MADRRIKQEDAKNSQDENIQAFIEACVKAKGPAITEGLEIIIATLMGKPTIENINNFIVFMKGQGLYENDDDDKTVLSGDGSVHEVFGGNFLRMHASGNNHDCLIHSFLTCVSTEFRTLGVPSRNEFANLFRRGIFPMMPVPVYIDYRLEQGDASVEWFRGYKDTLLKPGSDLIDPHVTLLCAQFCINILFFYTRRGHMGIYKAREMCKMFGIKSCTGKNDHTIMMKMDDIHFEPIVEQRPSGGGAPPQPTYKIDENTAIVLIKNNETRRKKKACSVCGTLNFPETETCITCGTKFPHAEDSVKPGKACSACTFLNPPEATTCMMCGMKFTTKGGGRTRRIKKKSKITRRKKYNLSWRKKYNLT